MNSSLGVFINELNFYLLNYSRIQNLPECNVGLQSTLTSFIGCEPYARCVPRDPFRGGYRAKQNDFDLELQFGSYHLQEWQNKLAEIASELRKVQFTSPWSIRDVTVSEGGPSLHFHLNRSMLVHYILELDTKCVQSSVIFVSDNDRAVNKRMEMVQRFIQWVSHQCTIIHAEKDATRVLERLNRDVKHKFFILSTNDHCHQSKVDWIRQTFAVSSVTHLQFQPQSLECINQSNETNKNENIFARMKSQYKQIVNTDSRTLDKEVITVQYNIARLKSVISEYCDEKGCDGQVDLNLLQTDHEWHLIWAHIRHGHELREHLWTMIARSQQPHFHLISAHIRQTIRTFSSYYRQTRILLPMNQSHNLTCARVHFCQILLNHLLDYLAVLGVECVDRM